MASFSSFLLLSLLTAAFVVLAAGDNTTRIHFYMHDIQSGSNATALKVIKGPNSTAGAGFGDVYIIDDPLTEGPSPSSAPVGRAQGFYAFASQSAADTALLLTVNLLFQGGPHNGSTLAVLSHDAIYAAERELPVVGGTGDFRMARGYVLMKTSSMNGGDAVLEWEVHVVTEAVDWAGAAGAAAAAGPAEAPGLAPPSSERNTNAADGDSSPKFYSLFLSLLYIYLYL